MSNELPVQEFQIGQRVQPNDGDTPFVIHYIKLIDERIAYNTYRRPWYFASALTLAPAPERKPYESTERRVVPRKIKMSVVSLGYTNEAYRPETDEEMGTRHTAERAEHDAQGDKL